MNRVSLQNNDLQLHHAIIMKFINIKQLRQIGKMLLILGIAVLIGVSLSTSPTDSAHGAITQRVCGDPPTHLEILASEWFSIPMRQTSYQAVCRAALGQEPTLFQGRVYRAFGR